MSQHRCIGLANEALQPKNTRLTEAWEFPSGRMRLVIATEIITQKRGAKPVRIMASFCPFCGERFEENNRGRYKGMTPARRLANQRYYARNRERIKRAVKLRACGIKQGRNLG